MKTIKNLYYLILCTLLLMPVAVMADNTLVIEPFDIKGGETKNLIIDLENDQAITLVQFDLQLPEGLSVEKRNGTKYMIGLAGNRTTLEDHSVSANFLTDPEKGDFYRVLLSSGDNIELEGTSGPVLSITIAAASTFKSGTIKLTGIELVSPNETAYHPAEVTLTILPSVTVTIQNKERAYGAANPEFTYTTSEEIDLTGKVTLATEATTTSNAGEYAITGTSTATDVNVTFVNGKLTVTPAALTVTANAQNKVFGANDPTLTYMVTGLVNNDQLTGKLTRDEGENVGTYAIKQGTLAASSNYTLSFTSANLIIAAKTVATPTIEMAASVTYDGTAQKPAVTLKDGETTIPAKEYTVNYSNNTNVGTATVTITDKEGGNYTVSGTKTFNITPKAVTAPAIQLAKTSVTYSGTAQEPAVTAVKDGETTISAEEYTVSYSNNTNAGTATVMITDKEGGNYTVSGSADFTITKAESSCTAPTAVQGLVFNGRSQALITAGEAVGGELQYSLDDNTWQTHVPTATNAATYTVYYKVVGDANHTDLAAAQLSITIAATAADAVTIELSESTFVYDGTAKEPGVVVKVGNVEIPSYEYTVGYSNNTNAGMATVTITDNEGGNYTVNGSITFNIAPKAVSTPTVELAETTFTYSGTAQKPAVTVKDGETTIPAEEYIVSYSDNTNAGTATVTIADKAGGNYTIEGSSASFTITKATLTVTAKDANRKEGEENPTFELTYSGFLNNETESVLTVKPVATTTATADSPAGDYAITVSGGEAQNYAFSFVSGTLTITEKIVITITAKNASREYGDANPTFEYTVTGGDITGLPELTCEATATSPAGDYAIKVDKGSITTNANFVFNNGTLTITKATLTVTASDASREEDEENPTFELTYSGFKNDETEDVLTVKPVATTTATANSPAGDYVITVSGGEAQNYDFSYVSGTLTVTEKEIIDGIATLSLEKVQGPVYTLSGQRVEQPRKGRLYIVNGHKVVLK